jgi:ketosteroid isomerase-like protein
MAESDERAAALRANERFYRVFAAGDAKQMDALWSEVADVLCTHPGRPALVGRPAVMQSWQAMLGQAPEIACSHARVSVIRGVALVTCLEHIGEAALTATNVFVWESGEWRLVHHHAGPLAEVHTAGDAEPGGHLH